MCKFLGFNEVRPFLDVPRPSMPINMVYYAMLSVFVFHFVVMFGGSKMIWGTSLLSIAGPSST